MKRQPFRWLVGVVIAFALASIGAESASQPSSETKALVGATVIDGNGGSPISDATIVITGSRITAVGPRGRVSIPSDANQVDVRGRWILPGLIDTNVHLSL